MKTFVRLCLNNQFYLKNVPRNFKRFFNNNISNYHVDLCWKTRRLILKQSQDINEVFPFIWLRDNCQCDKCFNRFARSRTISWNDFNLNTQPTDVKVVNGELIKISWDDGHLSDFKIKWLQERSFRPDNQNKYLSTKYRFPKFIWNEQSFSRILKKFECKDVLENDEVLYKWLKALSTYGVALIKNAPLRETACRDIASRVNFIKRTHYGKEFHVMSKENTTNVAYLSSALQLHTDLPYYEYKPGVNLLHCIVQTKGTGGGNKLTDCFYVAKKIKIEQADLYKILKKTLVNWVDIGEENGNRFHKIYRAPVICENSEREIYRINYSVPQRDSFFTVDCDVVVPWYEALNVFVKTANEHASEIKTEPGDILTFDNLRIVHGRDEYKDNDKNIRYVVGAYLDWDEIYSRIRVLQKILNK